MKNSEDLRELEALEKSILQKELEVFAQAANKEQLFATILCMKCLLYAQDHNPKWIKDVRIKKKGGGGYYGI